MSTPTWTKHDYEFFAQVIHNTPMSSGERIYLSQRFGYEFANDNPNFSWERWDDAIDRDVYTSRGGTAKYGNWTTKDYKMTANVLKSPELSEDTRVALISAFGAAFERDNPRFFDWDKFRRDQSCPICFPRPEPTGDEYATTLGREHVYRRRRSEESEDDRDFVRVRSHDRYVDGKRVHVRGHQRML